MHLSEINKAVSPKHSPSRPKEKSQQARYIEDNINQQLRSSSESEKNRGRQGNSKKKSLPFGHPPIPKSTVYLEEDYLRIRGKAIERGGESSARSG
jgi:hypothetical protein